MKTFFVWLRKIFTKWQSAVGAFPFVIGILLSVISKEYLPEALRKFASGGPYSPITILITFGALLWACFIVYYDMKKELEEKIRQLENKLSNSISENSIALAHSSQWGGNFIDLEYVKGDETIQINRITQTYIDKNGEKQTREAKRFFYKHGEKYQEIGLNFLKLNQGVLLNPIGIDETKDGVATVNITFTGLKTNQQITIEKQVDLKRSAPLVF